MLYKYFRRNIVIYRQLGSIILLWFSMMSSNNKGFKKMKIRCVIRGGVCCNRENNPGGDIWAETHMMGRSKPHQCLGEGCPEQRTAAQRSLDACVCLLGVRGQQGGRYDKSTGSEEEWSSVTPRPAEHIESRGPWAGCQIYLWACGEAHIELDLCDQLGETRLEGIRCGSREISKEATIACVIKFLGVCVLLSKQKWFLVSNLSVY